MRYRQPFDLGKAIPAAWSFLWERNLGDRAAGRDYRGQTTYLTATDLERQVRQFAQEQADGQPWGHTGKGHGLTVVRITGNTFEAVRAWLLRETRAGRLEGFNHGRGHVSGMRFRPAGTGPTESEQATVKAKAERRIKPALYHYSPYGYSRRPQCTAEQRKGRPVLGRPSTHVHTTDNQGEVNCPRCRKLLATGQAPPPQVWDEETGAFVAREDRKSMESV